MEKYSDFPNSPIFPGCLVEIGAVPLHTFAYCVILTTEPRIILHVVLTSMLTVGMFYLADKLDSLTTSMALDKDPGAFESNAMYRYRPDSNDLKTKALPLIFISMFPVLGIHYISKSLNNSLHNIKVVWRSETFPHQK